MTRMADLAPLLETAPVRLEALHLSEERFLDFCHRSPDLGVEQDSFAPIRPDLAIALLSASDSLTGGQAKIAEYMASGVRLGYLIDPKNRKIDVCRPGQPAMESNAPGTVSGDPERPGSAADRARVFLRDTDE